MGSGEVRIRGVACGDDLDFPGPVDSECGIVPAHAASGFGIVEIGHLVEDLAVVFESEETVGAAFGDEEHVMIVGCKRGGGPLLAGRRLGAQV